MNNQALTVLNFQESAIRIVMGEDGEPWFVIADVCKILEIVNVTHVIDRLDPDGVRLAEVIDSLGRTQTAATANEPNLYRLIFRSDKPEAKAFQDWVYNEVLPAIRKTGSYSLRQSLTQMQTGSQTLEELIEYLALSLHEAKKVRKHQRLALAQQQRQPIDYSVLDKPIKVKPVALPKPQPSLEEAIIDVLRNKVPKGEKRSARAISQMSGSLMRREGSPKVWMVLEMMFYQGRVTREGEGRRALYGLPE